MASLPLKAHQSSHELPPASRIFGNFYRNSPVFGKTDLKAFVFRFNDKPKASCQLSVVSCQLSVGSWQLAVGSWQNLEISALPDFCSSYSCDSFYSWFKILAFFEKGVIHESNAVFRGFA
jgi:hypothetical protein